jgi:hypothetical protein
MWLCGSDLIGDAISHKLIYLLTKHQVSIAAPRVRIGASQLDVKIALCSMMEWVLCNASVFKYSV